MPTAIRPIGHEDRLSLVEHLDELRSRLMISGAVLVVAFGFAVWQNHRLLDIVNKPLAKTTAPGSKGSSAKLDATARSQIATRRALESGGIAFRALAKSGAVRSPADRAALRAALASYAAAVRGLPKKEPGRQPVTLGVGEPLSTTLTVSLYFALLISLPLILYQLYAFVLPAFSPAEQRVAIPLMAMVPVLFIAGVLFGYFVVLPPAIKFLQNFNSNSFDVLVQAKPYYSFVTLTLLSLGILFQIPVGILGLTRVGIVSVKQLRANRRYAIVIIAVVAMLLPGTDPVTTLIEMVPLLVLYELSILMASFFDRSAARRERVASEAEPGADADDHAPPDIDDDS
ncbi:MAG TPA: twin-arginine translocase subunit TatC [Solirubrobacteraceae bacterium]